jgi:hypothetical protein
MKAEVKLGLVALCLVVALLASTAVMTQAGLLGDVVKVGAVGLIVDKFGPQINTALNKVTANKNLSTDEATAVVPIISLGGGGYIGAVQVIGAKENVEKCKAVVQIEVNQVIGKNIRAKVLVPVGSRTTSNIKRIYGVGVSAMLDIRI